MRAITRRVQQLLSAGENRAELIVQRVDLAFGSSSNSWLGFRCWKRSTVGALAEVEGEPGGESTEDGGSDPIKPPAKRTVSKQPVGQGSGQQPDGGIDSEPDRDEPDTEH